MDNEMFDQLLGEIMSQCWIRIQESNEYIARLKREEDLHYEKLSNALKEKAPELQALLESYIDTEMFKETEEDKLIYVQGAKDMVFLMKQVGIL